MNKHASDRTCGHQAAARPTPWLAAAAVALALCATSAQAANAVYGFDTTITSAVPTNNPNQTDSVVGSITTDGTLGKLYGGNILAWNLEMIDHLDPTNDFTLTNTNSSLVEDGSGALSATASGLFFDYGGSGEFLIQVSAYNGAQYFCFSTGGACGRGETISPAYVFDDGVELVGSNAPVGVQSLTPSAIPEPKSLALMLAGLGIVGVAAKRRRSA